MGVLLFFLCLGDLRNSMRLSGNYELLWKKIKNVQTKFEIILSGAKIV